jgi:hypothetical protein
MQLDSASFSYVADFARKNAEEWAKYDCRVAGYGECNVVSITRLDPSSSDGFASFRLIVEGSGQADSSLSVGTLLVGHGGNDDHAFAAFLHDCSMERQRYQNTALERDCASAGLQGCQIVAEPYRVPSVFRGFGVNECEPSFAARGERSPR